MLSLFVYYSIYFAVCLFSRLYISFFDFFDDNWSYQDICRIALLLLRVISVVYQGKKVLTQKSDPLMAQIGTRIDSHQLILSFPGLQDLQVGLVIVFKLTS